MRKRYLLLLLICFILLLPEVRAQNQPPVAEDDFIYPVMDYGADTVTVHVLQNDYDPEGEPIRIREVSLVNHQTYYYSYSYTDSTITCYYTGGSHLNFFEVVFSYSVCEADNPDNFSSPAALNINGVMSPEAPVAKNDTITAIPGYYAYVNPLSNDFHPLEDSLFLHPPTVLEMVSDSNGRIKVLSDNYSALEKGYIEYMYWISDTAVYNLDELDYAIIRVNLDHYIYFDSLDINNINARFNCFGNHFWKMVDGEFSSHFLVPNGTRQSTIFTSTLWAGGKDQEGSLHMAGELYRDGFGEDFRHGPVSETYDSLYDIRWFNVWKLNREDIEYHREHWWETGYTAIPDIQSWPGNGDTTAGQALRLAPYHDKNNNDLYEPYAGDYPIIRGDQALFFVFNDAGRPHDATSGIPLGIEVHGIAYAFDEPADSALRNTIFLHYDIINRSDTTYYDTHLSIFIENNIGYRWDDFLQCDVQRGTYFEYNGKEADGNGEPESYGEHPPAQGVVLLGGPYLDPDGIDNPKYDVLGQQICDYSINGLNFGDTIVDNERYGMKGFISFGSGAGYFGYPQGADQFYGLMKETWKDQTHMIYGGWGHLWSNGLGPECRFLFPGDSDPCNWGTNGIWPNGGYNQNGNFWTMESTEAFPGDYRGLMNTGPFTFYPGDVHQVDLAFVFARDYNGTPWSSVELMKAYIDHIRELFVNENEIFQNTEMDISQRLQMKIYPNPASDWIIISGNPDNGFHEIRIYDMFGKQLPCPHQLSDEGQRIDISRLRPGLYFAILESSKDGATAKFMKR